MNINITINNSKSVITVTEDAVHKDYAEILPVLEKAGQLEEVAFDLKQMYYIMSSQIAELLGIKKWAASKNIPVALLNVNPGVYQVLEMTNLLNLFMIRQDYSCYSIDELIDMFNSPENADDVSEYLSSNYTDEIKSLLTNNIKALEYDNAIIQEYSLLTIGRAYDDSAIEHIRKCLDSNYPNVVRAAILVLGWLGDTSSKERIYSFLKGGQARAEAAGASIALLSDDDDVAKLATLAQSEDSELRKIVAGVLSLLNGNEAFDVMLNMFKNESDNEVRKVLTRRISYFNKPEATEMLVKLLNDSYKPVQEAAAAGLERTGLRGHEDIVLQKVAEGGWVGYFAVKALSKACSEECSSKLISSYEQMDPSIKLAIVEVLGNCAKDNVKEFLLKRIDDENEDIRKEALSSLRPFKAEAATAAEKMVLSDESWLVRFRALEILVELRPANFDKIINEVKQKDDNRYIQEKVLSILGK